MVETREAPAAQAAGESGGTASGTGSDHGFDNPFRQNPYYGMMFMFAWLYCYWFTPDAFNGTDLLDDSVTIAWFVFLGVVSGALAAYLVVTAVRQRQGTPLSGHASDIPHLDIAATAALSLGGMAAQLGIGSQQPLLTCIVFPALAAAAYATLWMLWGEHYARIDAAYSGYRIGIAYAAVVAVCLAVSYALPTVFGTAFIACIPWVSLYCLRTGPDDCRDSYPKLLPVDIRKKTHRSIIAVCTCILATSALSYFTVAIIPLWDLPYGNATFTLGVAVGTVLIVVMAVLSKLSPQRFTVFHIFPWLLTMNVFPALLYLTGNAAWFGLSFVIALGLSSIYAIMIVMYSGTLVKRGYITPAVAFSLCGICVFGGTAAGNGIAVFFEHNLPLEPLFLQPVAIALIMLVVLAIIPLLRQQTHFDKLMAPAEKKSDLKAMVEATAAEFKLSPRETEILELLARGLGTERIARELVISNYTVQTHIQHIYTKTGIHKRGELLDYVTKHN